MSFDLFSSYILQTTDVCKFLNGYVDSKEREGLGLAENDQQCAYKAQRRPLATGAIFYPFNTIKISGKSHKCFAEYSLPLEIVQRNQTWNNTEVYTRVCKFTGIAESIFSI